MTRDELTEAFIAGFKREQAERERIAGTGAAELIEKRNPKPKARKPRKD